MVEDIFAELGILDIARGGTSTRGVQLFNFFPVGAPRWKLIFERAVGGTEVYGGLKRLAPP
jgi:hypothetical protein